MLNKSDMAKYLEYFHHLHIGGNCFPTYGHIFETQGYITNANSITPKGYIAYALLLHNVSPVGIVWNEIEKIEFNLYFQQDPKLTGVVVQALFYMLKERPSFKPKFKKYDLRHFSREQSLAELSTLNESLVLRCGLLAEGILEWTTDGIKVTHKGNIFKELLQSSDRPVTPMLALAQAQSDYLLPELVDYVDVYLEDSELNIHGRNYQLPVLYTEELYSVSEVDFLEELINDYMRDVIKRTVPITYTEAAKRYIEQEQGMPIENKTDSTVYATLAGTGTEEKTSVTKKVVKRTFKNLKLGGKIKLAGKANRAAVDLTIGMIPNKPEWMESENFKKGMLWLGPTLLQVVNAGIEDMEQIPSPVKDILAEAADLGQVDASMESTDAIVLPAVMLIGEILKNYMVAVGGKAAANLLTQDMVGDIVMQLVTGKAREEA